jgi:hypothetical protein
MMWAMRWILLAVFGFAGFCAGVIVSTLTVMVLHNTLAIPGIDAFTGLPMALIALVILIIIGGTFLGGEFGYRLGNSSRKLGE